MDGFQSIASPGADRFVVSHGRRSRLSCIKEALAMGKAERDCGVRFERECAKLLGIRRHVRGDWSESAPDLVTDRLVVEAKFRDKIAAQRWLEQCEGYAAAYPGRIPVCFARERRDSRPIAILRLEDFLDLILEAKKAALATDKTEG
jgi:hypothetical protein